MDGESRAPAPGGRQAGAGLAPAVRAVRTAFAALAVLGMAAQVAVAGLILAARAERIGFVDDLGYWRPQLIAVSAVVLGLGIVATGLFRRGGGAAAEHAWSAAAMVATVAALLGGPVVLLLWQLFHTSDPGSVGSLIHDLYPLLSWVLAVVVAYLIWRAVRGTLRATGLLATGTVLTFTALAALVLAVVYVTVPSTCCPW
ncbi:hypothetical protein ACFQY4_33890 [Catellatospora bangladeshensis]|uniref:Uncharacterized protein n=1 Tax=Catellatospora bangladeshensis TaxID=310355 RepID=A0A8J3JCD2_9ACTN|nr:hypothetical protein [Catellatospora bangladeshensis]GIF82277.1 hypothetical protein Cba03nite_36260 [Catellatospora bangladeshensis]